MSSFFPNSMEITSSVFAERYNGRVFFCTGCVSCIGSVFSELDDFVIHMMQAIMP